MRWGSERNGCFGVAASVAIALGVLLSGPAEAVEAGAADPSAEDSPADSLAPAADATSPDTLAQLNRLLEAQLLPAERDALVRALSAAEVRLLPAGLLPLLSPGVPVAAAIDGARIATRRQDPRLAPLMLRAFLNSKFNRIPHDPDVFEELLRGLQGLDPDERRAALEGLQLPDLANMVASRLDFNWLGPLTGESEGVAARFGDRVLQAVQIQAQAWIDELLRSGNDGWVRLQTDSGDRAFRFLSQLELMLLTVVIAEGEPAHSEAALEVARRRTAVREDVLDAVALLAAGGYPVTLGESKALQDALQELWPRPEGDPSLEGRSRRIYPVVDLGVPPASTSPTITGESPRGLSIAAGLALVIIGLIVAWTLVLRARPDWKRVLFPVGAVALVALGLLVLEGLLAAAGVRPLGMTRSTFNPASAPVSLYVTNDRDGRAVLETAAGTLRYSVFLREKPADTVRIFALGASSVHGSNYLGGEAWPALLGHRLEALLDGQKVESINAGAGGAVSDQVQLHAQELLDYDPDLLVLSLGYNDFEHVPALARYRAYSARTLALRFALDRSRVVRLLSALVPAVAPDTEGDGAYHDTTPPKEKDWKLIDRLTTRSFEQNLERAWFHATARGVPVLFLLQGQNEDLCGEGSAEGATEDQAHCFPVAMRRAVLRVAGQTGMTVVDTAAALRQHSENGSVGSAYYWDIIHPSRLGHAVISEAAAPAAMQLLREANNEL